MSEPIERRMTRTPVRRMAERYETRHPDWLVQHALTAGWIWAAFWVLMLVAADHFDLHAALWVAFVVLAVFPTFSATVIVLSQTPHERLNRSESVLGHFLSRFAGYAFAFVAWTASVVLSATIATQLQIAGKDNTGDTLDVGVGYIVGSVPIVVLFLWLMLILRYAWYLSRLRGWRSRPVSTRLPDDFLETSPRSHGIIVGLAHPGLLAATGGLAVLIASVLWIDEVTINLI